MNPAVRECARVFLDEIGTPHDAPARRMLERSSFAFDLENPLRLDNCDARGAIHWRDYCCDPSAQRATPSPAAVERSRTLRLVRAERSE
jgi:hypothetical protein